MPFDDSTTAFSPRAILGAGAVFALTLAATFASYAPPAPLSPEYAASQDRFSAEGAFGNLVDLLGEQLPHPTGSKANAEVRGRLIEHFAQLGWQVTTQSAPSCRAAYHLINCADVVNVIAKWPGTDSTGTVVAGTHYDSVPAGPGAADAGASVAALMQIAEYVTQAGPARNDIVMLITDGEERGLLGAEAFVEGHPLAGEVAAVINLEARGSSGLSFLFETSENNGWLVDSYLRTATRPATSSLFYEVYQRLPNDTDLTVFKEAGLPGLGFAFIDGYPDYHTPNDNLERLHLGSLQHQGDNALGLIRDLAARDFENSDLGNATYMDVLGLGSISWDEGWTALVGGILLLAVVATAGYWLRARALTLGQLLWGGGIWILAMLAAIWATQLSVALVQSLSEFSQPWVAYPLSMRLVMWCWPVLIAVALVYALGRRASYAGLALGPATVFALVAALLALSVPGVSVHFLFPLAPWAVFLLLLSVTRAFEPTAAVAYGWCAVLFGTCLSFLFLVVGLETALGFEQSLPIVAALAFALTPLWPLLLCTRAAQRLLLVGTSAVVVAGVIATIGTPAFSESRPQRLSMGYLQTQEDVFVWYAGRAGSPPPSELTEVVPLALSDGGLLPGIMGRRYVSAEEQALLSAPTLEVREDIVTPQGWRQLTLALTSPRQADELLLGVPRDAQLLAVEVAGVVEETDRPSIEGITWLICVRPTCERSEVTLRLASSGPFELTLADRSYGLPPQGQALLDARPSRAVPSGIGDVTIVTRRTRIVAPDSGTSLAQN